ncbi:lanthionine synthetase LanC family protein [Longimicrobium terrae]|uniref:Lantibiotic modifying enzyme n=1 Tax=Longimicrobium terrae TaxID=1639882 RepID=A0A841H0X3_9BACT|nr:lanthionine synthetase LanC family protein [Longimicrobium terrae]MBB4637135.1 lantibiotic modifying enzyme [Longimicrobium terrae]MBB6071604.1 lantibiotic modifying enzyme [Longimicrobium terrae]NNC29978.1 hypothetical protein [Longimicrobium terrae]
MTTASNLQAAPLDRAAVHQSILQIADALIAFLRSADKPSVRDLPGAALFLTHLGRASGQAKHREAAAEAVALSGDLVARVPMRLALYGGLAGMVLPMAHRERLGIADDGFDLDGIDEVLMEGVDPGVTPHFDLISGVVGLGAYFLERLPAPAAREGVRRVIHRLHDTAEHDGHGMRWLTAPDLIPAAKRAITPLGKYDLGMAHGITGVAAFLALALLNGADRDPAEAMLRETVRWLMALERADGSQGAYGTMVDPRQPEAMAPGRAAWCYGDPGVAAALLLASRALGDDALLHRAHALARHSAAFADAQRHRAVDTSLCHGTAGLAHLFRVLGRPADAERWDAETMAMRSPDQGVAGFYFMESHDGVTRRAPDATFLQGAAGVGLVLLSVLDPASDRSWDRLLLLS